MRKVLQLAGWIVLGTMAAGGQGTALTGATSDALLDMAAQAGVIFAGHVIDVARHDDAGYVDVRFRIDEPVRGCPRIGVYVLREWVGLWGAYGGPPRFVVGQRRLMLLHGRGASGMSSPVGGMDGAIPIVASATEPLADAHGVAPAEDGSEAAAVASMAVDLRWVETRVVRPAIADPAEPDWSGPVSPIAPVLRVGSVQSGGPTVATVLALLRGAGGASGGARGGNHETR